VITTQHDPVNCFVPDNLPSPVQGASDGPLAGLTFVTKDLFDVVGHRTSNGSPDFYRHAAPAESNATVITRLLEAGATLLGMTICDEFFYSLTGANAHYGTPINTRAPGRMPGGSSSGSAAAVAADLVNFSLGSDTGGSVRIPASFCGLWGIRPTLGRVALTGARAMAPSFDTVGWFSNEAALLSRIATVMFESKEDTTKINRIIIADDAVARVDAPVAEALKKWLESTSLEVAENVNISPEGLDVWWKVFRTIQAGEVKTTNLPWVRAYQANLGPGIMERFLLAESTTDIELNTAREHQKRIVEILNDVIGPGTVLIIPTAPCIAPRNDADDATLESFRSNTMALTCIAGLAGLPQISMPMLTVDGCPVGISLIGTAGGDERLLELAVNLA